MNAVPRPVCTKASENEEKRFILSKNSLNVITSQTKSFVGLSTEIFSPLFAAKKAKFERYVYSNITHLHPKWPRCIFFECNRSQKNATFVSRAKMIFLCTAFQVRRLQFAMINFNLFFSTFDGNNFNFRSQYS